MSPSRAGFLVLFAPAVLGQDGPSLSHLVLDNPCPVPDAFFGHSVRVVEFDGTGGPEIAVGAFGQGRVYVFRDVTEAGHAGSDVYDASGPVGCGAPAEPDRFGYDLAGGNLDGDPQDELVIGAPATDIGPVVEAGMVYLLRHPGDTDPVLLRELNPAPSRFGESVEVGDFDGDGVGDIAVSAPVRDVAGVAAGAVHVFFGPFDQTPPSLRIDNPQPVEHGNFGIHLAVGDVDADGIDDLVVSAIGNSNQAGLPRAGQVYVYPGPIDPARRLLVEDPFPDPNDLPGPRFGMHVAAREDWVLVGANRKDAFGLHDPGMGYSTRGPSLSPVNLHPYPQPDVSDYMGFRCVVADLVGDSALDLTWIVLAKRQILTWDGNDLLGRPLVRPTLHGSADHFGNGFVAAQVFPGGRDEVVAGDPTFDVFGTGLGNDTGRVVVYAYE